MISIVVIFFDDDAHNYEFIENRWNPCPIQSLQDTLCTFFKVQSAKMESIDTSFKPKLLNHVHRQLNTEVFDQLIVVLMNKWMKKGIFCALENDLTLNFSSSAESESGTLAPHNFATLANEE